uniref:Ig-like domain-containing protein n=1 Tax=Esox lucius TaxID=8010 RepID=A0A3P8Y6K9_ESOLU
MRNKCPTVVVALIIVVSTDLPTASVSVSPHGLLYSGETVTLQCDISVYTDWTYRWYQNNQTLPTQTSKTVRHIIPIIKTGQTGLYRCEGMRTERPQRSEPSNDLSISVSALPKATLLVKPNPVYPGETVTLTCSVGSYSDWRYKWYKDSNDTVVSQSDRHTVTGDTLTISRAAESDQGLYWCQGERDSRPKSTSISQPVSIIHCLCTGSTF